MGSKRLIIALLTVILYEIIMQLFKPDGFSFFKLGLTLLIWISLYECIIFFLIKSSDIRADLPKNAFRLFVLLIIWNIINILRSAADGSTSLTTLMGNPATSLALLVPFAMSFSVDKSNIVAIFRFLVRLIIIAIPVYILFFILSEPNDYMSQSIAFQALIFGTVFLISYIPFVPGRFKIVIILGSILLFYVAIQNGSRTMLLRILLLFIAAAGVMIYRKYNFKWILFLAMFALGIPFFLVLNSIHTRQSPFEKYLIFSPDYEMSMDTRTFLYTEVFDDLKHNEVLTTGKGSVATYYSPYFAQEEGDSSTRLSVEVGILAILLSGGFMAVILNLSLILLAIFLAMFRSNNHFIAGIAFMLIIHTILLFIENFYIYSMYNLAIWFFIGLCLSKEIRSLKDDEINNILLWK